MAKRVLRIGGMSCGHCQSAVTQALEALEGVTDVIVDLASGTAKADVDESRCGEERLRDVIEEIGFDYLEASLGSDITDRS